jgi:hypothetical protein
VLHDLRLLRHLRMHLDLQRCHERMLHALGMRLHEMPLIRLHLLRFVQISYQSQS